MEGKKFTGEILKTEALKPWRFLSIVYLLHKSEKIMVHNISSLLAQPYPNIPWLEKYTLNSALRSMHTRD